MDLNCQECDAVLKRERGCVKKGLIPFTIDGAVHFRCPIRLVNRMSWEYIRAYSLYKKGITPNGKGWLKESEKYLNAMGVIDSEIAKMQNKVYKKASKKRGK